MNKLICRMPGAWSYGKWGILRIPPEEQEAIFYAIVQIESKDIPHSTDTLAEATAWIDQQPA